VAIVKVNVGCGPRVISDWINFDSSPHLILSKYRFIKRILYTFGLIPKHVYETYWPYQLIKRTDLRKGLPLENETVDFIYCSHFLEHLPYSDSTKLLSDCHRVLKRKGWIRIVVPDLRIIARKYLDRDITFDLFRVSSSAQLSEAFVKSLYLQDMSSFLARVFFQGSIHRFMYDFDSLKSQLNACGFNLIEKRQYREGITPDITLLDNRPEESLYVEAQKL
jgi:predicted SAM-dependent methyltransferase